MEKALNMFLNGYSSLPPPRAKRGSFLDFHHRHVMGFLEGKPIKMWVLSKVVVPSSFSPSH